MSSPETLNTTINFLGAGDLLTSATLTQSGAAQLQALNLDKDSSGAVSLSSANLEKMRGAKLLDYNGQTGQYSLNITLLAPQPNLPSQTALPLATDGLFRVPNSAAATANLLSTQSPSLSQMETTPQGAMQLQAAAPAKSFENPYLQGKQGKLMILMQELLFIQSKIALYDKDSSQKTMTRAIDNVQMQAAAIARKYDANDVRLKGDITAAQMTIGVDVLGMALQVGALTGLGLLGKAGHANQSAEGDQAANDRLTLARDRESNHKSRELAGANPEERTRSDESEDTPLLRGSISDNNHSDRQERSDDEALAADRTEKRGQMRESSSIARRSLPTDRGENASRLTLSPEQTASDSAAGTKGSKFLNLAKSGLNSFFGENGLSNAFDQMARNYIQIDHSTTNIAANDLLKVADQSLTSIELQKSMIQQQLTANKDQSKKTSENVQSLLDLVLSLSRTSLENERTLFRG